MKTLAAVLAALPVLSAPAVAQEEATLEERFYRAYYAENGLRDFEKAAEQYAEVHVAARAANRKDLAVKALLGRARCMRTLGKPDEVKAALAGVIEMDPENEEARAAASAADPDADQALRERIEKLVHRGLRASTNEETGQAARELRLLGDRCLPVLSEALSTTDLPTVETAAIYLASMDGPAANEILIRAMRDPRALYRVAIARAVLQPTFDGSRFGDAKRFASTEVPVLAAAAEFPDSEIRKGVFDRLAHSGDSLGDSGISLLLRIATDPDRSVRMTVLEGAAARLAAEPVLALETALRRSLADEDSRERVAALKLAGYYSPVQARLDPAIRPLLRDPDADVRAHAFDALRGRFTEGDLAGMIDPVDSTITAGALEQLRGMAPWTAGTVEKAREGIERTIRGEFEEVAGAKFTEVLQQGLVSDRRTLIDLFALTGAQDAVGGRYRGRIREAILYHLNQAHNRNQSPHKEQAVAMVEEGVETCMASGDALRRWVEFWFSANVAAPRAWMRAAASDDERARSAAYRALMRQDPFLPDTASLPADALPHLARDLVSSDGPMRAFALRMVGRLSSPSSALAEPLRKLHDESQRAAERTDLLFALVKAAGREAEPAVRADFANPDTRGFALQMLVNELGIHDRAELDAFVEAGGEPHHVVALADKPNPPDRALLSSFVMDLPIPKYSYLFLPAAARCVDGANRATLLRRALLSEGNLVRSTATKLIGDMRVLDLWPDLVKCLDSGEADVRTNAEKSLAALKHYAELKSSLANFGKDAQDAALRDAEALLKDPDPLKRKGAVLALAALGERSAIPALLKALDDENQLVRQAALAALERLGGKSAEPAAGPR